MPDIISKTQDFAGFSKGRYFSENMKEGEFGLGALYKSTSLADSSTLAQLAEVRSFADIGLQNPSAVLLPQDATRGVAAQDVNGVIYARDLSTNTWTELYKPLHATHGGGILHDGRYLYYVGDEYLGRAKPWATNAISSAGTVAVTNGSANVTGTGTAFNNILHNRGRIRIAGVWYTVNTASSATALTLTTNYAGATASGVAYSIFAVTEWEDEWQDFGAARTGYTHFQPFLYEGDIIIPRQDALARYNATDGSFNDQADDVLDLPSGFYYRAGAGNTTGILLAVEPITGGTSYLILWDNRSLRSIAPWIPLRTKVQAIRPYDSGWLVVTQRQILYTNGYTTRPLSEGIDDKLDGDSFSVQPNGIEVLENRLIIANQVGGYGRKRSGIYVYDVTQNSYDYVSPLNHTYEVTPSAVFLDSMGSLNVSVATDEPSRKHLTTLTEAAPSHAYVITKPVAQNGNAKNLGSIKADMAVVSGADAISGTVSVKVAAINRRLWGIQKAKTAGANTTSIVVDGTLLSDVQVGDEVVVMQGANAGLSRHISAISGSGTTTETWTLDTALTGAIEANCYVSVTPFRKVATKTVTSATELRDMYFNCQNSYKGKKWLVKVQFENLTVPVEILEIAALAQDQGPRT